MTEPAAAAGSTMDREQLLFWAAVAGTLVLLLAHAGFYTFLTDDAFISFRYAVNLGDGHGLVYNPGFERVEGYTNFLWVLILAFFSFIGAAPETVANPLLLVATVGVWAAVLRFGMRVSPPRDRLILVVVPLLLLAVTRSVAVWSTSGLETRLFELLVVAATFRLLLEVDRTRGGEAAVRPLAALLFGLAILTRPDGLLITGCAFAAAALILWRQLPHLWRWAGGNVAVLIALSGGHFLFRYLYYGEWLPNTYYAKVVGLQWEMGARYLAAFGLEYAMYVWIPLLVAGVLYHRKSGTLAVPILFGAVCLPHALYVASIGGDHFEYRPLDLYFPFAYLLIAPGLLRIITWTRTRVFAAVAIAVIVIGILALPYQSHRQFPPQYLPGFPGHLAIPEARAYLDPERSLLYGRSATAWIARTHRDAIRRLTFDFVGLRQEEHDLFQRSVVGEGLFLGKMVEAGLLPPDTYVATGAAGVIPYYSGLRTLDRLGLTDAHVARSETKTSKMAHGKRATTEYARRRGVDFWAVAPAHFLWNLRTPNLVDLLGRLSRLPQEYFLADLGDGIFLVTHLPQGIDHARKKFPQLEFLSSRDDEVMRAIESAFGTPGAGPGS